MNTREALAELRRRGYQMRVDSDHVVMRQKNGKWLTVKVTRKDATRALLLEVKRARAEERA